MAGNNQDDDSWDFKLDSKDLESANLKKKTKKASGATPDINRLKKKKKKKLSISEPVKKKKMSRSAIARRDAAAQAYAELMPPGFISRLMATILDGLIIVGIVTAIYFLQPTLKYYYIAELAKRGINQTLDPQTLQMVLIGPLSVIMVFLIHLVPAMRYKATIGKSIFKMRIGHHTIGERPTKMAIFLREGLFKPISIISVIGVLIGLKNDGNRPLHDMLCGTALYIDD